jgi:hypothetical protein
MPLTRSNPPSVAADASADAEWALLGARAGLTADEHRAAVAWWGRDRQPGEGAVAFLVRQGVLLRRALKEIELVRKGYVVLDDFRHLFAPEGRERIRPLPAAVVTVQDAPPQGATTPATPPPVKTGTAAPAAPEPQKPLAPEPAPAPAAVEPPATAHVFEQELPKLKSPKPAAPKPLAAKTADVGQVVGKCLLTERVGEGGSGVVFRALHQGFNIPVAVKLLQLSPEGQLTVRLGHEAQLLARLNHPHIVRVWDFDDAAQPPYMVLEWVDGLSLEQLIQQSGRMSVPRALRVIGQVAGALAEAHRLGIVHRDVKPANILLTRDGTAKLADLGLAVVAAPQPAGERTVSRRAVAGTVSHMGPELFSGRTPDHLSDMYALGVTFYQALTGAHPFPGPSRMQYMIQHAEDTPTPPHQLFGDIPSAVSAVVMRLLEKEPEARFGSYQELADALAAAERPAPAGAAAPMTSGPAPAMRTDPAPPTPPTESIVVPKAARRSLWRSLFGGKADDAAEDRQ